MERFSYYATLLTLIVGIAIASGGLIVLLLDMFVINIIQ